MSSLAFAAPILPGKSQEIRRFAQEALGPRRKEYVEYRQGQRLRKEYGWIQPTPMGDLFLVYLEGEDVIAGNRRFAESRKPFYLWFKQQVGSATGLDLNQPLPTGFVEVIYESEERRDTKTLNPLAIAFPIVAGQTEAWRRWIAEMTGPRLAEFRTYLQRIGLDRENWYLEHTPQGDLALVYIEGENPAASFQRFVVSDHPFDVQSRKDLGRLHGIDFSQPPPGLPELVMDGRVVDQEAAHVGGI